MSSTEPLIQARNDTGNHNLGRLDLYRSRSVQILQLDRGGGWWGGGGGGVGGTVFGGT